MELGHKIRQLRYRASLTQEQLAERLNVTAQAVSKWENAAAMPDIGLLPLLAEVFGVSMDELFDLTADQKLRRIGNALDVQEELTADVFREYEELLKEQAEHGADRQQAVSLLAQLYHHRMEADARRVSRFAREAVSAAPEKKECQWLLQRAEGSAAWDWNCENHSRVIDFYRQVIENEAREPQSPLPYYYLLDNLIADHRTREAADYLARFARLPGRNPVMVPAYEAAIALAEYDEKRADAIMEKALADFPADGGMLFEAAQYYARKCDYDRAVRLYEAAYAAEENSKPRFTDALEAIAMIHEIRGDCRSAADTQRRILTALREEWGFTEETVVRDTQREIERLEKKQN